VFSFGRMGEKYKTPEIYVFTPLKGERGIPSGHRGLGGLHSVRWRGFWASSVAVAVLLTTLAVLPSPEAAPVPSGSNPPLDQEVEA